MSSTNDREHRNGPTDEDRSIRAAEIALGLTEDRAEALRSDPALLGEVEVWEADLAALVDELASIPPRAAVWTAVQAAMDKTPQRTPPSQAVPAWRMLINSLGSWKGIAAVGWTTAAALLAMFALMRMPEVKIPEPQSLLVSSLLPKEGGPLYVVAYNPERAQLVVVPATPISEPGRIAQLWLVPNDTDEPIALTAIQSEHPQVVGLSKDQMRHVVEGAGLVITLEPEAFPNPPAAQGPVVAHGRLARA